MRSWLADPHTAMWAIILTTVWWVTGYYLVIYLAGLQDIPRELYEAAALDGAGGMAQLLVDHAAAPAARCSSSSSSLTSSARSRSSGRCSSSPGRAGRRHPHRGPAPLRDRLPELLPVRLGLGHGVGALRRSSWSSRCSSSGCCAATRSTERVARAARPSPPRRRRRASLTAASWRSPSLWLLPAVWVLVTSLKRPRTSCGVPPEWIPWPATIDHYGEVLFSSSRTARIGRAFLNSTSSSLGTVALVVAHERDGRLSAGAHAVSRAQPGLRAARRQPDDPERGDAGAAVRARPAARLAQHLPGADRARGGDDASPSASSCSASSS